MGQSRRRSPRCKPARLGGAARAFVGLEALEVRELLAALVGYSLEITDAGGNVASQIVAGQSFNLNVYTEDLRGAGDNRGVGSAYVDIVYSNPSLLSTPGDRVFGDDYPDIRKPGEVFTGKLNNAGATNFGLSGTLGLGKKLVFSVPFTAAAVGSVMFQTTSPTADADPGPGDDDYLTYNTILQEPPQTVAAVDTNFGQTTLTIVQAAADAGGPYQAPEQGSVVLDGEAIVAPGYTPFAYEWDLDGDGQYGETGGTPRGNERTENPTFLAGGLDGTNNSTFPIGLRVVARRTSDGALFTSDVSFTSVQIVNVAPTVSIVSGDTTLAATGQPVTFVFSASDPAPADQAAQFTYEVNWGDGTTQQLVGPATNATFTYYYSTAGNFQVSVKAIDKDGGASSAVNFGSTIEVFSHRVINGDLIIGGTTNNEDIIVILHPDGYFKVQRTGQGEVRVNTSLVTGKIIVYAGPGNDDILLPLANTRDTIVYCGPGRDSAFGTNGKDTFYGENGRDLLYGRANDDMLYGGADQDNLNGDRGSDTLYGGDGPDTLRGGSDPASVDLDVLFGGGGRDTLYDDQGLDALSGGEGDDRVIGLLGRTLAIGGPGRDAVYAGPENPNASGAHGGVVIGDTTIYDNNAAALRAILAEWASASSFNDRVNHLLGAAGGLNGATFLRKNIEVLDDGGARDVLIGGSHSDLFYQFPVNFFGPGDPGAEDQVV